jgi:hypothetical protein
MTEAMAFFPLWMLLFTGLGLMIGLALGDEVRRRKNAEEQVDQFRKNLPPPCSKHLIWLRLLKEQRGVLNDIHKRIVTVSKGIEKPAP